MDIRILPTGMIQTNCILLSKDNGDTLVIDPGADAESLLEILDTGELKVVGYPLTHGHYDHVLALHAMHAARPAPCYMHPLDLAWAFTPRNQNPPWYTQPDPKEVPEISPAWETDGTFDLGGFSFETLHLPGHSPGSVGFYFPGDHLLIGGDVLFKGSMGRTDLPGGDGAALYASLRRLAELPPETVVIPGHGPDTTIGEEIRTNPYMREALGT
jgi:hydroxyacylglutathione hydrolase